MKIEAQENIFISLISDTTFKYLFKNEDTKDFLISIIKDKFGIDLNDYKTRLNSCFFGNYFHLLNNLKNFNKDYLNLKKLCYNLREPIKTL